MHMPKNSFVWGTEKIDSRPPNSSPGTHAPAAVGLRLTPATTTAGHRRPPDGSKRSRVSLLLRRAQGGRPRRCTGQTGHAQGSLGGALSRGLALLAVAAAVVEISPDLAKCTQNSSKSHTNYTKPTPRPGHPHAGLFASPAAAQMRPFWRAQAAGRGIRLPDLSVGFLYG